MEEELKLMPRPKRALTAYNYYFHSLRSKLLSGEELDDSEGEDTNNNNNSSNPNNPNDDEGGNSSGNTNKEDHSCLSTEPPTALPPTGASKISFANLGKIVGRRWHRLTEEQRAEFVAKAALDKERYNREMAVYSEQQKTIGKIRKKELQQEKKKQRKLETNHKKNLDTIAPSSSISLLNATVTVAPDTNTMAAAAATRTTTTTTLEKAANTAYREDRSRNSMSNSISHEYYPQDNTSLYARSATSTTATAAYSSYPSGPFSYYAPHTNTENYYNPYYHYDHPNPTTSGTTSTGYEAYYFPPQPYSAGSTSGTYDHHPYSSTRLPLSHYQQPPQPYTSIHNRSQNISGYDRQDAAATDAETSSETNDPVLLQSRSGRFVSYCLLVDCIPPFNLLYLLLS